MGECCWDKGDNTTLVVVKKKGGEKGETDLVRGKKGRDCKDGLFCVGVFGGSKRCGNKCSWQEGTYVKKATPAQLEAAEKACRARAATLAEAGSPERTAADAECSTAVLEKAPKKISWYARKRMTGRKLLSQVVIQNRKLGVKRATKLRKKMRRLQRMHRVVSEIVKKQTAGQLSRNHLEAELMTKHAAKMMISKTVAVRVQLCTVVYNFVYFS